MVVKGRLEVAGSYRKKQNGGGDGACVRQTLNGWRGRREGCER